ncbi:MAG: TIGR00730 family Rossman fold protein [Pseudomonadota bacterium]
MSSPSSNRPPNAVCVYCASSDRGAERHRVEAERLGRGLARGGAKLVYGGGHVGLMGVCADGALAEGGAVHGVIPKALQDREVAHNGLTELTVTPDMQTRKTLMFQQSDAICALPGGLGTLDELCEALTWRQLGFHQKPILLVNIEGFWGPLLSLLTHMDGEGYLPKGALAMATIVDDADAALAAMGFRTD